MVFAMLSQVALLHCGGQLQIVADQILSLYFGVSYWIWIGGDACELVRIQVVVGVFSLSFTLRTSDFQVLIAPSRVEYLSQADGCRGATYGTGIL